MKSLSGMLKVFPRVGVALLLVVGAAGYAAAQICVDPPAGLVSWWPGDGNANDIEDGNDGTPQNGATFAAGMVGQAFSFDGVAGGGVQVADSANLNTGAQITIEAWIKPFNLNTYASIVNKRIGATNVQGYTFELIPGNGLQFQGVGGPIVPNVLTADVFQHVAVTYDGSAVRIYVNGVEVGSQPASGSINPVSADLFIGKNIVTGESFFGLIDEVAIYNRGLSATEIQAIFLAGSNGKCKAIQADFFLHANGSTLSLDSISPTASAAQSRDSAAIRFSGGDPWREVGTWAAAPAGSAQTLTAVGDLHVWLGLKNSDDIGTRFDLRAELYRNGTLVASGEKFCITGVTRNPNLAKEVVVSFGSISNGAFTPTDALSLRLLTRIGTTGGAFCGGHSNAIGLRLYFDAVSRPSRFETTLQQGGGVLATGQTTPFTADKNDGIPGAVAVNDDGTLQLGAALSYQDNGDGTVTDLNTGLMWEKKLAAADTSCTSEDQSLRDLRCVNNVYLWSGDGSQETIWDWLDDLNASNFAGHSDWRIPNVSELYSIVNYGVDFPSIAAVFGPTPASPPFSYWSSTTVAGGTGGAWVVDFDHGNVSGDGKIFNKFVRAVRGGRTTQQGGGVLATGQTTPFTADKNDGIPGAVAVNDDGTLQLGAALSYQDNGDGTVTDLNTGLMWEKKLAAADTSCTSEDQSLRDLRCVNNVYLWSGDGSQETIWDWLDDLNASNFAGHSDWRIPNVRELYSIVNHGVDDPSLAAVFGPTPAPPLTYWSSTTTAGGSGSVWVVDFNGGNVGDGGKMVNFFMRAVRGGS